MHAQLEINTSRGEILPKPSGQEMNTLHVAGDGPVPWRCGSRVKSAGGSCLGHCPPPPGREVIHAQWSALKPRGSASKAAVSAGVGAWQKAVDGNSLSNLIYIHGLHVSSKFRCLTPPIIYFSHRSHHYFQKKSSMVTELRCFQEGVCGSLQLSCLAHEEAVSQNYYTAPTTAGALTPFCKAKRHLLLPRMSLFIEKGGCFNIKLDWKEV